MCALGIALTRGRLFQADMLIGRQELQECVLSEMRLMLPESLSLGEMR